MTSIECNVHTARLTVSKNTVFLHKEKMLKNRWNSKDLWNRHIFVLKFLALQLFLLIYINRRDMSSVSLESVVHRERRYTNKSYIIIVFISLEIIICMLIPLFYLTHKADMIVLCYYFWNKEKKKGIWRKGSSSKG